MESLGTNTVVVSLELASCLGIHMHTYSHAYTHTHTCTHAHTHTHMHARTHTDERDISPTHKFYSKLSEDELEEEEEEETDFVPSLFRLSDEGGSLTFSLVAEGALSKSQLDPSDGKLHTPPPPLPH